MEVVERKKRKAGSLCIHLSETLAQAFWEVGF